MQIEVELLSMLLLLNGNRLVRIGETSIHYIIFIKILVIDLDSVFLNRYGRLTVLIVGISILSFNYSISN